MLYAKYVQNENSVAKYVRALLDKYFLQLFTSDVFSCHLAGIFQS